MATSDRPLTQEDGLDAWLRYAPLPDETAGNCRQFSSIIALNTLGDSPVNVAGREMQRGLRSIARQDVPMLSTVPDEVASAVVIGLIDSFPSRVIGSKIIPPLKEDGFWLDTQDTNVLIVGQNERGALYGSFEYLSMLAQGDFSRKQFAESPSASIRYADQWDNLDGSIERGYGGLSIFFRDGLVVKDMTRVAQYARLLASVRLNGVIVNNVNSNYALLQKENLEGLGRIANAMRPYGIRIGISLYFDTPKGLAGLPTSDPLDQDVIDFWNDITAQVHEYVPDLIGYLIKANSEGQPGPLTYGRTLADAANMFGRALKKHGEGIVMYRAFVYNHHLDESKWKNDRANAAVEYFDGLDDEFDDNVLVQIKFGPIDFQIREPPSPLLAKLRKTGAMIEFMVCQEYLGQQSHYVYQAPLWKTILDFDFRVDNKQSLVSDILSGQRFDWKRSGYSAVVNIGDDNTWLGHHLSMSNLYAYGRLAWNPKDDPESILRDWARLTWSLKQEVIEVITHLGMDSWPAYENYSGNLGIQTLCDILYTHFGPSPGSMDGNGWGQWTRADSTALGMDRTVLTGTGNAGQYPPEVAQRFESIETVPEELLLWFHHVPYTHRLRSGKTVIQHFYDAHYAGAEMAQTFPQRWNTLKGFLDEGRYNHVAFRLAYQAGHAIVWRDSVNEFYKTKSCVPDELNRVGNYQWRIEAESMSLDGYEIIAVSPPEAASGGAAVKTISNTTPGTAATKPLDLPTGSYDIAVNYFDHLGGMSRYEILLGNKCLGKWSGDLENTLGHDFSERIDGHSATRIYFKGVHINKGDILKIVGYPDGSEAAPLDYVSIFPEGIVD